MVALLRLLFAVAHDGVFPLSSLEIIDLRYRVIRELA